MFFMSAPIGIQAMLQPALILTFVGMQHGANTLETGLALLTSDITHTGGLLYLVHVWDVHMLLQLLSPNCMPLQMSGV